MFERILVPLDGSALAERSISVAARLARASGGTVVLARIMDTLAMHESSLYEVSPSYSPAFAQEVLDREQAKAQRYLHALAHAQTLPGVKIETRVLPGAAAQTILEMAHAEHIDLIVICYHGRTGFERWVIGSMAPQLARLSPLPVLVLREGSPEGAYAAGPLRALVALDSSACAEAALMPTALLIAALAAPTQGTLHLAQIVQLPPDDSAEDDESWEQALRVVANYLGSRAEQLRKDLVEGPALKVSWSIVTVTKESVADALIRVAEAGEERGTSEVHGYDLIAMATHGRGGVQRQGMGSIPERVLDHALLPLLTVRPQEQPAMVSGETTDPSRTFTRSGKETMTL